MFRPVSLRFRNLLSHKDTEYNFDKGVPKLIYGENLDDPGQEGNGSGKSGFAESLSILITGKVIRNNAKVSDLIKDGEDEMILNLVMDNTKNNKRLVIERKLYRSEHKSQVCTVTYGDEPIVKSRVTEYSPWILGEIGISEDDFRTYYLVTQENYNPFFSLTALNKQSMVNRFSGADSVDLVDPFIKKDMGDKDIELKSIESSILSLKSKAEVYQNQLDELELKNSQEEINRLVQEVELQVKEYEKQISEFENVTLPPLYKEIEESTSLLEEKKKQVDQDLLDKLISEVAEIRATTISELEKELTTKKMSMVSKVQTFKQNNIQSLELQLDSTEKLVKSLKVSISKLDQKLEESIECPKCNHSFDLKDDSFDKGEIEKEILELTKKLDSSNVEMDKLNKDILDSKQKMLELEKELEMEVKEAELNLERGKESLKSKNNQIDSIKYIQQEIKLAENNVKIKEQAVEIKEGQYLKLTDNLEGLNLKIEEIKKGDPSTVKVKGELTQLLEGLQNQLKEKDSELIKVSEEKQKVERWLLLFKSFKAQLANRSIKNIEDYTNLYLSSFKTNLSIKIEGYKDMGKGKLKEEINISVLRDGFPVGQYSRFSLGERTRLDLANIISLQELMNINAKNGLDLLVCDDVLNGVDVKGMEIAMSSVQNISKTILIVTQHYIPSQSSNTVVVRKESGSSKLVDKPRSLKTLI